MFIARAKGFLSLGCACCQPPQRQHDIAMSLTIAFLFLVNDASTSSDGRCFQPLIPASDFRALALSPFISSVHCIRLVSIPVVQPSSISSSFSGISSLKLFYNAVSQAVIEEFPYAGLPPSRYPDNMRVQPLPNGQPALPYTGTRPSQYPNNIRGQAIPQAQSAAPYEGTTPYTDYPYTAAPPAYVASTDSPSSSRLLHVYHSGMTHRNIQILGPEQNHSPLHSNIE